MCYPILVKYIHFRPNINRVLCLPRVLSLLRGFCSPPEFLFLSWVPSSPKVLLPLVSLVPSLILSPFLNLQTLAEFLVILTIFNVFNQNYDAAPLQYPQNQYTNQNTARLKKAIGNLSQAKTFNQLPTRPYLSKTHHIRHIRIT